MNFIRNVRHWKSPQTRKISYICFVIVASNELLVFNSTIHEFLLLLLSTVSDLLNLKPYSVFPPHNVIVQEYKSSGQHGRTYHCQMFALKYCGNMIMSAHKFSGQHPRTSPFQIFVLKYCQIEIMSAPSEALSMVKLPADWGALTKILFAKTFFNSCKCSL